MYMYIYVIVISMNYYSIIITSIIINMTTIMFNTNHNIIINDTIIRIYIYIYIYQLGFPSGIIRSNSGNSCNSSNSSNSNSSSSSSNSSNSNILYYML